MSYAMRRLGFIIMLAAVAACGTGTQDAVIGREATVTREPFGMTPEGDSVELFTLTNANGVALRAMTYGGIIVSLTVPDRDGKLGDVVLGYDSLAGYLRASPYFGAIVGRYANRIAKGTFVLDGKTYHLAINNPPNALHGGLRGFDKVVWTGESFSDARGTGVVFHHTSPDGDEGYPGTVTVQVSYTLTDSNDVVIDYQATTDKATPINLSQHSYFNLAGAGSILGHELMLAADSFTPIDSTFIPTGVIAPVAGTPFDFRTPHPIGERINDDNEQLRFAGGYDHNFVLNHAGTGLALAARLSDSASGRVLEIRTDQPGIQFYSGNFLDGTITGKHGVVYAHRSGLALETQHFPDSPNHPGFPSTILEPGQQFRSRTLWHFGIETDRTP
jgi:aldose 1-epimerase